jgi:hypothetical protein
LVTERPTDRCGFSFLSENPIHLDNSLTQVVRYFSW